MYAILLQFKQVIWHNSRKMPLLLV